MVSVRNGVCKYCCATGHGGLDFSLLSSSVKRGKVLFGTGVVFFFPEHS